MENKRQSVYPEKIKTIKNFLSAHRYSMIDFWLSTNYSPADLQDKTRKRHVVQTRQVGVVWAVLSGLNLSAAGELFDQDHSTVIHSIDCIVQTIEHPNMNKYQYQLLLNIAKVSASTIDISSNGHVNMQRLMDYFVHPVLNLHQPSQKAVTNLINNRINQTKIAV